MTNDPVNAVTLDLVDLEFLVEHLTNKAAPSDVVRFELRLQANDPDHHLPAVLTVSVADLRSDWHRQTMVEFAVGAGCDTPPLDETPGLVALRASYTA